MLRNATSRADNSLTLHFIPTNTAFSLQSDAPSLTPRHRQLQYLQQSEQRTAPHYLVYPLFPFVGAQVRDHSGAQFIPTTRLLDSEFFAEVSPLSPGNAGKLEIAMVCLVHVYRLERLALPMNLDIRSKG
jgi:hypothetical protein